LRAFYLFAKPGIQFCGIRVRDIRARKHAAWHSTSGLSETAVFGHAPKVNKMSDHAVPHFQNDAGVSVIEIGSREFMCVGANPPFDHPHVFLDLGNDNEIICPYCSTLYRYAADLAAGEARPPECVLKDKAA
jgi:uncharacterized Zn-finger protein